ncbi:MAG: hypothetical protein LBG97_02480 [Coriobacteriales bacterium]|jgi:hypothetical protein|nr:hypothetical protein [Coriobacteriales bacterium]
MPLAMFESAGWLEETIGIDIPDAALFVVIGVIVLVIILLILKGFLSELKKK